MKQLYLAYCKRVRKIHVHTMYGMAVLFMTCLLTIPENGMATQTKNKPAFFEIAVENTPLKEVLREIERQTGYTFVINHNRLTSLDRNVTISLKEKKIEAVLNKVLEGTNVTYSIRKKQITLIPDVRSLSAVLPLATGEPSVSTVDFFPTGFPTIKKLIRVSGKVTDDTSEPLPGVNIVEKGTTNGTVTDSQGNYSVDVASEASVLVFSFIGFTIQEIAVGSQTAINIQMVSDAQTLGEVVVVGYGTQEKKDVTGAISSVKGTDLQDLPVSTPQQALQGRAAGVNIVRSGGEPGNSGAIRIRGVGTVNNADPLIVVDGVPSDGPLADVNPNDIESIDILKDASASAIYGTRAANGVVMVTTKRGKAGQLKLSVNGYTGVSNRVKSIDVLDAPTLAVLKRERYANDGLAVDPIWQDPTYQTQKTDWQKEVLGTGKINNLDISISGGSDKSTFAISGGKYDEQGMISNSYFKRYSLRINSDHKISERFKIGQSLQLTSQSGSNPNTTSAQDGLVWSAIRFHPSLPVKNPDGTYSSSQLSPQFGDINNPIFTIDTQDRNSARTRVLGSVTGDLEIIKGLHARANIALDASVGNSHEFNIRVLDQTRTTTNNSRRISSFNNHSLLQEYFLSYNKQAGVHDIGIVAGYSQQTFDYHDMTSQRKDLASEDPSQRYLSSGTITDASEGRSYDALQSAFGRATYSLKSRYLATVTFRADASSKFAPDNRWAYFPAFSLGWRVSEEPFFQGLTNVISSLKVTGGYGELGNSNIPRLNYLALINSGYRYSFGGGQTLGSAQGSIANPNIAWERAIMTNVGLEAGLLSNKILVTLAYFNKRTEDMLLSPPSLGSNGTAIIPVQNVGELENKGIEIEISYRKTEGEFSYSIGANATYLKNEVTNLVNGNFLPSPLYGRSSSEISRTYVGSPIASFYGWKTDGLYQNLSEIESDPNISADPRRTNGQITPGDVRFRDLNGDHIIDDKDRAIIGNPTPGITYGISATLGYKGIDLGLNFVGSADVDNYNADRMQGIDPTYPFNMYAETANRWHGEGTSNSIPRMSTAKDNLNHRTSDLFVESGAFFRLKTLTLGYTLPQSISSIARLSRARFYVTGQNVFTITNYSGMDPELGIYSAGGFVSNSQINVDYAQYPQARTWTIGAQLSF